MSLNKNELAYWSRKRNLRRGFKISVVVVILAALVFLLANYCANLPRERDQLRTNGFISRAYYGLKYVTTAIYYSISADNDVVHTKLPVAEIYIKGARLDQLNSALPESGRNFQKADFKYKKDKDRVEVRYRGDSVNHWSLPQKSWRVQMRGDNLIDDLFEYNLTVPRVDNQISNWLGYQIAKQFGGMIVPKNELVHFKLNRNFNGIRLLLEQFSLESLEKRNLPAGKIFTGDISTEHIYGGLERPRLYADANAWSVLSATPDEGVLELKALFDLIANQHQPYLFYQELPKLVDMDGMLRYIAMLEMVGSVHVDSTHNGKLFYNPISGLLQPIAWDTVAYFWGNDHQADLAPNPLFRVILANPEFRDQKDQILYKMISGKLGTKNLHDIVDGIVNKARKDIRAFGLKIHASDRGIRHLSNSEWEDSIVRLKQTIADRNKMLADRLESSKVEYNIVNKKGRSYLIIKNIGASTVNLKEISFNGASDIELKRLDTKGLENSGRNFSQSLISRDGKILVNDKLFSKRKHQQGHEMELVPGIYQYEIIDSGNNFSSDQFSLDVANTVSGAGVDAKINPRLKFNAHRSANATWWSPAQIDLEKVVISGKRQLSEDLIIKEYQTLVVEPGTVLSFAPRKSIFIDGGNLHIKGSEQQPVKFVSATSQAWGGLMILNSKDVQINHLQISGASSAQLRGVRFDSPLSLHYSKAEINHLQHTGSISLEHSQLTLSNSIISSRYQQALRIITSRIKEENNKYKLLDSTLDIDRAINSEGHGTAGRWEREYKYTFLDVDVELEDPLLIAEKIRSILAEKSLDPNNWSTANLVNNKFYADDEVKEFMFRDIYFDTEDRFNHRHGVSYRYRNRYKSDKSYKYHLKDYQRTAFWPYRLEFQAKTKRIELGGGFSSTLESRFEFRKESDPYSQNRLPPAPPWDESYFVPGFLTGEQDGFLTIPAKSMAEFYVEKGGVEKQLKFEEACYVLTVRYRQHLNIQTPYGSGPNPEQSYIISLDHSKVYAARSYQNFLRNRKFGNEDFPEPPVLGNLVEIEVEFERNVSDVLDRKIKLAEESGDSVETTRLKEVRQAFIEDQKNIMELIKASFAEQGIKVEPIGKSKFVQAMDILEGEIK